MLKLGKKKNYIYITKKKIIINKREKRSHVTHRWSFNGN